MEVENNELMLLHSMLDGLLNDLLSGYSQRRSLNSHNGVTAAIYCFISSGDLSISQKIIDNTNHVVSYICAMRDERIPETSYFYWHQESREITDYLVEKGYIEKPTMRLFCDLVGLFIEWYEGQSKSLDHENILEFIEKNKPRSSLS